jgi:hypothetical protein
VLFRCRGHLPAFVSLELSPGRKRSPHPIHYYLLR